MSDQPKVEVVRANPPEFQGIARNLTPNDEANLAKIAALRGSIGKLRAQVFMARNILLRNEHQYPPTSIERDVLTILSNALALEVPQ